MRLTSARVRTLQSKRLWHNPDVWGILILAASPFLMFWQVTLAQRVWFTTDIIQIYYPFAVELGRALAQGRLPLWTQGILAGFPLVAEGHVSAFYPVNLVLLRLLPPHFALSYGMLLHLAWAGVGMYACARSFGFRPITAFLAGLAFAFNGYSLEKLYHTPIVITSAWLPWLVFLQNRFREARSAARRGAGLWLLLMALAIAFQLVAGFPQTALLSMITLVCFGLWGELAQPCEGGATFGRYEPSQGWQSHTFATLLRAATWTALPLALGVGIAAIQLIPTFELIGESVRSSGLNADFQTEYSLPPAFLSQFLLPYSQGEPIEHTNEYWAYFGFAPFLFAGLAVFVRRDRRTNFWVLFALGALSLALGNLNPLYSLVDRLPVFNLFRTPARYILLFLFPAILLSAAGFQLVLDRLVPAPASRKATAWVIFFAAATVSVIVLGPIQPLDFWLQTWQVLPFVFGVVLLIVLFLFKQKRIGQGSFGVFIVGLTVFDLAAYAPPFLYTLASLTPPSYVESIPRSVPLLEEGRVYTDLSTVPTVPALRGSLFPNTALTVGKASVQANSPLIYARHSAFLANLSPQMLNVLNVRYFMLPLEPRFTDRTSGPYASLALDILDSKVQIPPTPAASIEVASYTEQTTDLSDGTPVANVIVGLDDGSFQTFPLRVGIETDDWDFERVNAGGGAKHDSALVARMFPGFARSFGRTFLAHTYLARHILDGAVPARVVSLTLQPLIPRGRLTIERVSLVDSSGQVFSLAALTGKNDFELAFMSDTVAVWENLDVLPRAFIAHRALTLSDDAALELMRSGNWDPQETVLLGAGNIERKSASVGPLQASVAIIRDEPERIELDATTDRAGYLVLADSWYPGWKATVDGQPALIYRADLILRAVALEPGRHRVVFEFDPFSVRLGAATSIASLLLTALVALAVNTHMRRRVHD